MTVRKIADAIRANELHILLQKRRDKTAAKRFFKRVLAACPGAPHKIVTNQLRNYPAAKAGIPELTNYGTCS